MRRRCVILGSAMNDDEELANTKRRVIVESPLHGNILVTKFNALQTDLTLLHAYCEKIEGQLAYLRSRMIA